MCLLLNYENWCLLTNLLFKMFHTIWTIICKCCIHLKLFHKMISKEWLLCTYWTWRNLHLFDPCFWLQTNKIWIQFILNQSLSHFMNQHNFHKSAPHQHSRNSFVQQRMIYMSRKIKARFCVSIISSVIHRFTLSW